METLKTGDILLFTKSKEPSYLMCAFDTLIEYWTHSNIVHCGIVLKDPVFIHPTLKGLYIWESGIENEVDPQDNKKKIGVQITPFYEYLQNSKGCTIYVRRCTNGEIIDIDLMHIHNLVYNKPYDMNLVDWLDAAIRKKNEKRNKNPDRFWCSSFVAFVLNKLKFIDDNSYWSITRPCDLSTNEVNKEFNISFINGVEYSIDEKISN
jgi:hypothetical protein